MDRPEVGGGEAGEGRGVAVAGREDIGVKHGCSLQRCRRPREKVTGDPRGGRTWATPPPKRYRLSGHEADLGIP